MNSSPLISVVIPTFNRAFCIERAMDSVLSQGLNDLELIVIDDCSTDSTISVLSEKMATDSRIRFLRLHENGGVSVARNRGIALAKGKYILFLDSDDELLPSSLETLTRYISREGQPFVIGRFDRGLPEVYTNDFSASEVLISLICQRYHFCLATILWSYDFLRREQLQFRLGLNIGEDKLFLVQALTKVEGATMVDKLVLKINDDGLNSLRQRHLLLSNKLELFRSRVLIFGEVAKTHRLRLIKQSAIQVLVALKLVCFHFSKKAS